MYITILNKKLNTTFTSLPVASLSNLNINRSDNRVIAKLDSGATHTYLQSKHNSLLQQVQILHNGPKDFLPNKSSIQADRKELLPLHKTLSDVGKMAYSFPQLKNESLVSVGQLCDDSCRVFLTKILFKY